MELHPLIIMPAVTFGAVFGTALYQWLKVRAELLADR